MVVYPDFVVVHREGASNENPLVISLSELSLAKEKNAKDPRKVLEREHVFKLILEKTQEVFYFACKSGIEKARLVGKMESFLAKSGEKLAEKSIG